MESIEPVLINYQDFIEKEEHSKEEILGFFLNVGQNSDAWIQNHESGIKKIARKIENLDQNQLQQQKVNEVISICKRHLIVGKQFSEEEIQKLIKQKIEDHFFEAFEIMYLYGDENLFLEYFDTGYEIASGINIFYEKERKVFFLQVLNEEDEGEEEGEIRVPTDPDLQYLDLMSFLNILPEKEIEIEIFASINFTSEKYFLDFVGDCQNLITHLSIENLPFDFSEEGVKVLAANCKKLKSLTVDFGEIQDFSPFSSHSNLETVNLFNQDSKGTLKIPILPPQIKSLNIVGANDKIYESFQIPKGVTKLVFQDISFFCDLDFPDLEILEFTNCPEVQLKKFPDSLKNLIIQKSDIKHLPSLPEYLNYLILKKLFNLEKYPDFPSGLKELELKKCKPQEIPSLPVHLDAFIFDDKHFPVSPEKKIQSLQKAFEKDIKKGLFLFNQFCLFNQDVRQDISRMLFFSYGEKLYQDLPLLVRSLGIENLNLLTFQALEKNVSFFFKYAEFLPLQKMDIGSWIKDPRLKEFFLRKLNFKQAANYQEIEERILEDIPTIEIDELKSMLEKVNFDDPKKAGYIEKRICRDDDGSLFSPEELQKGMGDLLGHIHQMDRYQGVPKEEEVRKIFYLRLERRLKHVIDLLKKEPDLTTVNKWLVDLAIAGHHCGTRWESDSNQAYYLLKKEFPIKTFEDFILLSIAYSIVGFIEETAIDFSRHPKLGKPYEQHVANYLCSILLLKTYKISNKYPYEKNDPYLEYVKCFFSYEDVIERFNEFIHLYRITKRLKRQINSELMGNIDFQDAVMDNVRDYLEKNMMDFDLVAFRELKELDKELKVKQRVFGEKIVLKQIKELPFIIHMLKLELEKKDIKKWMLEQTEEDKGIIRRLYGQMQIDLTEEIDEKQKQSEKNVREFEEFYQYALASFEGKPFTKNETFEKKFLEEFPIENLEEKLEQLKRKRFEIFLEDETLHQRENPHDEGTKEYKLFEEMKEKVDLILEEMQKRTTIELLEKKTKDLEKYKKLKKYLKKETEPPMSKKAKTQEEEKINFEKELREEGREEGFKWLKQQKNAAIDKVMQNFNLVKRSETSGVYLTLEGTKTILKNFDLLI